MSIETKATHSPTPWTPAKETPHTRAEVFQAGDYSLPIAEVFGDSYATRAANARLIAAAPELLEVLKAIREHYRNEMSQGYRDFVDAAIRKAEGK